jgi:hypothetical protein
MGSPPDPDIVTVVMAESPKEVRQTRGVTARLVYERLRLLHPVPRLARHARDLEVVPWQALDLAEVGLTEEQVRAAAYWLDGQVVDSGGPIAARWSHAGPDTPCWDACCCSRGDDVSLPAATGSSPATAAVRELYVAERGCRCRQSATTRSGRTNRISGQ